MEYAQNTFEGGIVMDYNVGTVPDNILTDALNATMSTFNGNEQLLQNDMGNAKITYRDEDNNVQYAKLPDGAIPIGAKTFGRIMYIVSVTKDGIGEIGSFPSPNYDNPKNKLVNKYQPLHVGKINKDGDETGYPLRTEYFRFDLQHPVEINVDNSYDGSINLILTDNKNKPRIINTGFAVQEDGTYHIIDRFGKNNTNRHPLYDETAFDISTSLYNDTDKIVNFAYLGLGTDGKLMVGNYVFYAIACDKDGNESDIIAESGVVPVFIGTDGDPFSINGGSENMRTDKSVKLRLIGTDNIKYIKICYTRASSANNENLITSAYKIDDVFYVEDDKTDIFITGFENTQQITTNDINVQYFNADKVKSQAMVSNILFQANLTQENQENKEYEKLKNYSLSIIPYAVVDKKVNMASDYSYEGENNSYYNSDFTYKFTGYHPGEIYRFGIVYIRKDNSFTSVFDVLGVNDMKTKGNIPTINFENIELEESKPYCTSGISNVSFSDRYSEKYPYNIKGVCRINESVISDLMQVVGVHFSFTQEMPNAENYKGYFFVRQKRIPTLIAQGYATNICEESFLPSINVEQEVDVNVGGMNVKVKKPYHMYESFCSTGFQFMDAQWREDYPNFYPQKIGSQGVLLNGYYQRLFSLPDKVLAFFDKLDSDSSRAITVMWQQELNQDISMMGNCIYDGWEKRKLAVFNYRYQNSAGQQYCMITLNGRSTAGNNECRLGGVFLAEKEIDEHKLQDKIIHLGNTTDIPIFPSTTSDHNTFNWAKDVKQQNIYTSYFQHFYDSKRTIKNIGGNKLPAYEWYYALAQCLATDVIIENSMTPIRIQYDKKGEFKIFDDSNGKELQLCTIACDEPMKYGVNNTWSTGSGDARYNKYKLKDLEYGESGFADSYTQENLEFVEQVYSESDMTLLNPTTYKNGDIIYKYAEGTAISASITKSKYSLNVSIYGISTDGRGYNIETSSPCAYSNDLRKKDEEYPSVTFHVNGQMNKDGTIPATPYQNLLVKLDGIWYEFQDYAIGADDIENIDSAKNSYAERIRDRVVNARSQAGALVTDGTMSGYEFDISTYNGKYDYPKKKENGNYGNMAYIYNPMENNSFAMFCPDYELNMPYYNNIFTGQELVAKTITSNAYLQSNVQRLYQYNNTDISTSKFFKSFGLSIEEGMSLGTILHKKAIVKENSIRHDDNVFFSAKAGDMTTKTFSFAGAKFLAQVRPDLSYTPTDKMGRLSMQKPYNLMRGLYGSYVGLYPYTEENGKSKGQDIANKIVNLYIPGYSEDNMGGYFTTRFNDRRQYYRISDSQDISTRDIDCYRGDCFIGWYTHRVNRNFNDSSAPYNDTILQGMCFTNALNKLFSIEYRSFDLTKNPDVALDVNLGDMNAVQMGSWVTFPCRSSRNICIRSTNEAWTDEKAHSGNARSFYPLHSIDPSGSYKLRESDNYNEGFSKSGGDRLHFNQNNYIWENNYYKNRIQYSNILVNGNFENGNRVFLANHYRDYTDQYGAITKIVSLASYLLVICEHGIMLVPVNERALAGEGAGGFVYINTSNVLPETPKILSEDFGSTWPESVISTPYGVFGVDSNAKKIWACDGSTVQMISDFRIQSFLNDALPMDGMNPDIGKVNIKSHYNMFKGDVIFTAYCDDTMWSLCYNLHGATKGGGWQTFYSWLPAISGNIGNCMITLDHQVNRHILGLDHSNIHDGGATHYLWKHGQSDAVMTEEAIKPTFWYGTQHPFEFEFVVRKDASVHKVFNDLRILSNKAAPESFHYEVIGECYDLGNDKPNMYYRQEITKALYNLCLGSRIKYNPDFTHITPKLALNIGANISKSTMFPLYYRRIHDANDVESYYQLMKKTGFDYQNLSGSEIIYNELLNEFRIWCHVKGVDMKKEGRIRGNMHYKEDCWYVQIPSITYMQKNEYVDRPFTGKPIINLGNNPIPDDAKATDFDLDILNDKFGTTYNTEDVSFEKWSDRKEMKLKDKYIKIRIRYTGDELAVVGGVLTLYNKSAS